MCATWPIRIPQQCMVVHCCAFESRSIYKPDSNVRNYSWLSVYMSSVQQYTAAGLVGSVLATKHSCGLRCSTRARVLPIQIPQQCIVVHWSYTLTVTNSAAHINRVCIWIDWGCKKYNSIYTNPMNQFICLAYKSIYTNPNIWNNKWYSCIETYDGSSAYHI